MWGRPCTPCAAAEGPAGRLAPAPGGRQPLSSRGQTRISRAFPAAAGTASSEKEEREITRRAASRHILILSRSRARRAPVTERPRGLAFRGSRTFLGWGGGNGTASSRQAGGLRSEKAIFRGGSSGETRRRLRTYGPVLELVLRETRDDPRPQPGLPGGGGGADLSARTPCLPAARSSSPSPKAPESGTSWEPSLFILNSLLCSRPKLFLPIPRFCAFFPARWQHRAGGVSF